MVEPAAPRHIGKELLEYFGILERIGYSSDDGTQPNVPTTRSFGCGAYPSCKRGVQWWGIISSTALHAVFTAPGAIQVAFPV